MSHLAVRLVADWLNDPDEGVNAIAALLPRDGSDAPPPAVSVYDETRDAITAHGPIPRDADQGVSFPAILVTLQEGTFGEATVTEGAGGPFVEGTVSVVAELVLHETDAEEAATEVMYLLRAMRGSLIGLNRPDAESARERTGIRLLPGTVRFGRPDVKRDDLVTVGAVIATYPVWETIPT